MKRSSFSLVSAFEAPWGVDLIQFREDFKTYDPSQFNWFAPPNLFKYAWHNAVRVCRQIQCNGQKHARDDVFWGSKKIHPFSKQQKKNTVHPTLVLGRFPRASFDPFPLPYAAKAASVLETNRRSIFQQVLTSCETKAPADGCCHRKEELISPKVSTASSLSSPSHLLPWRSIPLAIVPVSDMKPSAPVCQFFLLMIRSKAMAGRCQFKHWAEGYDPLPLSYWDCQD